MGALRYSLTNRAAGLAAASFKEPTLGAQLPSDTGYTAAALGDRVLGSAWRSSAAANTPTFVVDLGAAISFDLIAVGLFGVAPVTSGVTVTAIDWDYSNVSAIAGFTGVWKSVTLGTRGIAPYSYDGSDAISLGDTAQWIKIRITQSSASKVDVGEVWISDDYTDLSRQSIAALHESETPTIENRSETRNAFVAQLAGEVDRFELPFGPLSAAHFAEVQTLWRTVGGSRDAFVLWPDSDSEGVVYLGRLQGALPRTYDAPLYQGVGLAFVEEGRGLP